MTIAWLADGYRLFLTSSVEYGGDGPVTRRLVIEDASGATVCRLHDPPDALYADLIASSPMRVAAPPPREEAAQPDDEVVRPAVAPGQTMGDMFNLGSSAKGPADGVDVARAHATLDDADQFAVDGSPFAPEDL